jgi:hypothetical protein
MSTSRRDAIPRASARRPRDIVSRFDVYTCGARVASCTTLRDAEHFVKGWKRGIECGLPVRDVEIVVVADDETKPYVEVRK